MQSILKIITLHTFFLSTLMSLGMILSRRKETKNQIFFGLFLSFSLLIFYFFLYESKQMQDYPYLAVSCLMGIFLIGPLTWFLVLYSLDRNFRITKRQLLHLVPALFAWIIAIVSVRLLGHQELHVYHDFFENLLILILGGLGDLIFSVYLFLTARKLFKNFLWNFSSLRKEPAAMTSMVLFVLYLLAGVMDILTVLLDNYYFLQATILLISLTVIILFIMNLIYPNFEQAVSDAVIREKERRSYLSNVDNENLEKSLRQLMESEELFTDENLSLKKLAIKTQVTTHQLSEFINVCYKKNYSHYINEYRIAKARKLLLEKPDFTILAIGYEVGFKSKSSFNDAFLKVTGQTPSQFKKNPA
ncbi:MAG: AraC family transcriptional regulator [Bacteroidales bacterium]|nr:AraC family transcriptional regulator [Bacteroidales bacterium]